MRKILTRLALALVFLASCRRGTFDPADYNPDWTPESHGQSPPHYSVLFPQDSVNRIDIIMTAGQWVGIQENMIRLWGFSFGANTKSFAAFPDNEPEYVDVLVRFNGKVWKRVGFRLKGNVTLQDP